VICDRLSSLTEVCITIFLAWLDFLEASY
jgi:hypothetical protein